MSNHNFKELKVWQKAIDLTVEIYRVTSSFPGEEKFGLITQIRRSAISISSNIAEGCGRKTDKELYRFLSISLGSANELETQLIVAGKLNFLTEEEFQNLINELNEIQRMTHSLQNKLNPQDV